MGSLRECQALLELVNAKEDVKKQADLLGGHLYTLAL